MILLSVNGYENASSIYSLEFKDGKSGMGTLFEKLL
jgi:hypothetical protein